MGSITYGRESAPPVIGERYAFDDGNGGALIAKVTAAFVSDHDKKMYIGLDNGQLLTRQMSDVLLQDYKKHSDTFFGVIREQGKSFEEGDDYGFFEHMVKIHLTYERENLLKLMEHWPNQDVLKTLSHEEIVLAYCEGLIVTIKEMKGKSKAKDNVVLNKP